VKCAGCGKEIPPAQQEFTEVGGEQIPKPCAECVEKKTKEIGEYPTPWKRPKPKNLNPK
jgi:hypothetical protein